MPWYSQTQGVMVDYFIRLLLSDGFEFICLEPNCGLLCPSVGIEYDEVGGDEPCDKVGSAPPQPAHTGWDVIIFGE